MKKERIRGTGMEDGPGQVAGITVYIFLLILYIAFLFIPSPADQTPETDRIRQQIRNERMIQ